MKNKKIRISLCNKIILIIVVALFVCTCLWTSVMFFNISNNAREVALTDEKNNMYNVSAQLKDVEETCYLVRQLVLQKNRIFEYIQKVQNNQDYKGVEKLDFYKNEIGSIDAMVDINPYIMLRFMPMQMLLKKLQVFINLTVCSNRNGQIVMKIINGCLIIRKTSME